MARNLIVLKYMRDTPAMATCEWCHLKFFTPLELIKSPVDALEHLHKKFGLHECRRISFSDVVPLRQQN